MERLYCTCISTSIGLAGIVITSILYAVHMYSYLYLPEQHNSIVKVTLIIVAIGGFYLGRVLCKLQYIAMQDSLTQLWNKRYFDIRLTEEMSRKQRTGAPLCIALADVDNFKKINDNVGHIEGDNALVNIAKIFRQHTRNTDVIFRLGGDEFAILFPETPLDEVRKVLNRIREAIVKSSQCHQATISVGVIEVKEQWDNTDILKEVDKMLYKAKENKNLVLVLD